MVLAVESVVGSVHLECQSQRPSREGRYLSVKIGPVWVTSGDQVIAVYAGKGDLRFDKFLRSLNLFFRIVLQS